MRPPDRGRVRQSATKVILNQDFTSGLTQPAKLLDYFPYLAPPPES